MTINQPEEITLNFIKDIQTREKRIVNFLGEKIIINKNVFPIDSPFSYTTKIVAKRIPKNSGRVLDVGTGTGVFSVIAAKKGAKEVLAIDIDGNSLQNAKENIEFHKLAAIIKLRKSNLLDNIEENEKFDLVLTNLPLADVDYENKVGHFLFDPGFKIHEKFLKEAKNHLSEKGKIFIPSGEIANEKKLLELVEKYGYKIEKVEIEKFQGLTWKLYILTTLS